jgi:hypothetical protein
MRLISYLLALAVAATGSAAAVSDASDRPTAPRCLRFEQPLGYSASGERERGDSSWYVLQLGDSGTVTRPLFSPREREQWNRLSAWTTKGDTLRIRVTDGLAGWNISLWAVRGGFAGIATYLTDVVVVGWVPPRMDVHAASIECPAPLPL